MSVFTISENYGFLEVRTLLEAFGIMSVDNSTKYTTKVYLFSDVSMLHILSLMSLTLGLQQAGDVELPLGQEESLFQVLLVASCLGQ